jgi:hypothetical protein
MRRRAIIRALLLVGVGVVLGATVFRTDIAQATGLAQGVTVINTPAQAVPVREQNLDGSNIRVHEEGTPQVRPTPTLAVNAFSTDNNDGGSGVNPSGSFGHTINATMISIDLDANATAVSFYNGNDKTLNLPGPASFIQGPQHRLLTLTQPIPMDRWQASCLNNFCGAVVWVDGSTP